MTRRRTIVIAAVGLATAVALTPGCDKPVQPSVAQTPPVPPPPGNPVRHPPKEKWPHLEREQLSALCQKLKPGMSRADVDAVLAGFWWHEVPESHDWWPQTPTHQHS